MNNRFTTTITRTTGFSCHIFIGTTTSQRFSKTPGVKNKSRYFDPKHSAGEAVSPRVGRPHARAATPLRRSQSRPLPEPATRGVLDMGDFGGGRAR
jgi:hypothetical protein